MSTESIRGRLLGALLLLHLLLGLIGPYVILVPMTAPPGGFLENAAAMQTQTRLGTLSLMAGALILMLITLMPWRTWRANAPRLAATLLALAGAHLALQLMENAQWLTMLSVSTAYHEAGHAGTDRYAAAAIAVRAGFHWVHYSHILVLVTWILVLFAMLRQARLLPRWLAASGIGASVLHLAGIPLPQFAGFQTPSPAMWGIPLAILYLGSALWLLARGTSGPVTGESRETGGKGMRPNGSSALNSATSNSGGTCSTVLPAISRKIRARRSGSMG